MVMDQEPMEMPAPDVVGREFVRQYYTLLHDAPEHAHRFYNSNSYFVHGSMTKPAIGQLEIHQKIQQLNFRDCHAKISQVDSQVTLGNGVVVHVSGELSNDGEPMRRFSQTFVLGTQSPKKYYVHNDIFRYQDMLLSDEEGELAPEKDEPSSNIIQETATREYYPPGQVIEQTPPVTHPPQPPVAVNAVPHAVNVNGTGGLIHEEQVLGPEPAAKPLEPAPAPGPVMNGGPIMPSEDLNRMMQPGPGLPEPVPPQVPRPGPGHHIVEETTPPKSSDSGSTTNKDDFEDEPAHDQIHISEAGEQPRTTFANLFKPGRGTRGMTRSSAGRGHVMGPGIGSSAGPPPHHASPSSAPDVETSDNQPTTPSSGSRPPYPDSHQIFLGKLPQDATDSDLMNLFGQYGKIVELRIQPNKGTTKANFGFVTYEDPSSVSNCLNAKPISLRMETGSKVVLNVEEKKPQHKGPRPPQSESGSWHMGRGALSGRGRGTPRGTTRPRGPTPLPRNFSSTRR